MQIDDRYSRRDKRNSPAMAIAGRQIVCASLLVMLLGGDIMAAAPRGRRARRPTFPPEVTETFFPDAREKLVGSRPSKSAPPAAPPAPTAAPSTKETPAAKWSELIAAETVEDEIKARQAPLARAVENSTRFKSGQYQQAQQELGLLAALLAIVAEYNGDIRWQSAAPTLRDSLARSAIACKTATDATFQQAQDRSQELQSLVRGQPLSPAAASTVSDWSLVADRTALMRRLDEAEKTSLGPDLASADTFADNTPRLLHEAQIVAALAELITRPGYEFADDETYIEYAKAMQRQALELRKAALEGNYETARRAAGELRKSCTNCHEGYRS